MPLIFAAIAPHGSNVIPQLEPDNVTELTRQSMLTLGKRLESLRPDTVIVLTPHGIRIDGMLCISVSERAEGKLDPGVEVAFDVDQEVAQDIAERSAAAQIPVAQAIFGASSGPGCAIPLDWGAVIPLWFMGAHYDPKPQVVVICPSRRISAQKLMQFGRIIAEACQQNELRISLIASADQGHAHSEDGPYGFNPASEKYDTLIQTLVRENRLHELVDIDLEFVNNAMPDSLWQLLILAGALDVQPMRSEFLSYEIADYFGMLCAAYRPDRSDKK